MIIAEEPSKEKPDQTKPESIPDRQPEWERRGGKRDIETK